MTAVSHAGVLLGVAVRERVAVAVGVDVLVIVPVGVRVGVVVRIGGSVTVTVGVGVGVGVTVGVGDGVGLAAVDVGTGMVGVGVGRRQSRPRAATTTIGSAALTRRSRFVSAAARRLGDTKEGANRTAIAASRSAPETTVSPSTSGAQVSLARAAGQVDQHSSASHAHAKCRRLGTREIGRKRSDALLAPGADRSRVTPVSPSRFARVPLKTLISATDLYVQMNVVIKRR